MIGVNNDYTLEDAKNEVEENKLNWQSFYDDGNKIATEFGLGAGKRGWPTILLIDENGVIQYEYSGNKDELDAKIEEMVANLESKESSTE